MTIFEKILSKEIPATIVYETEKVLAFKDIAPQAKIHILFIHKLAKTKDVSEMMLSHPDQISDLFQAMTDFAKANNLGKGYRIVTNIGDEGGQTVYYTHFHLLSGEKLGRFGK